MAEPNPPSPPLPPAPEPAEADNPAARRHERMLAYLLGALDEEERGLIAGRLESDPEWRQARDEAQKMLESLKGAGDEAVPEDLGLRTVRKLREAERVAQAVSLRQPEGGHGAQADSLRYRKPWALNWRLAAAVLVVCALPALWLGMRYLTLGSEAVSFYWQAEPQLAAGAPFAPQVMVRDCRTHEPLAGIQVRASLTPRAGGAVIPIGQGATSPNGVPYSAAVDSAAGRRLSARDLTRVPDVAPGEYNLVLEALSATGRVLDRAERTVKVTHNARLALAPDRLQARPGETIRARALLVSTGAEKPLASQAVTLDLFDPTGNRIAHSERTTTRFGLAWAEFPLDSEAPEGTYRLCAQAPGLKAERTVEVKQYRLPPFRVRVETDRSWLGFTDSIAGRIEAQTFDGNPLRGAKAELTALTDKGQALGRAGVTLDADGRGIFEFGALGRTLADDVCPIHVEAVVTDSAERTANGRLALKLSRYPVILAAVPEAGELVQGVTNRVYVVARYPDGKPCPGANLNVVLPIEPNASGTEAPQACTTDAQGVAVFELPRARPPAEVVQISATLDGQALPARNLSLPVRPDQPTSDAARPYGCLLVRSNSVVLAAGTAVNVQVISGSPYDLPVTLALRQEGRTVAAGAVRPAGGRGQASLVVPSGAGGVLTLVASQSLPIGHVWRDQRVVFVAGSGDLKVAANADRQKYRPGERARVDFRVTNGEGQGVPAAVSVVGVDEALLALTGEHPGLVQALQAAGVQVFASPDFPLDVAALKPENGETSQTTRAAFAAARVRDVKEAAPSLVDTAPRKAAVYEAARQAAGQGLGFSVWVALAVALVLVILLAASRDPAARGQREVLTLGGLFGASLDSPIAVLRFTKASVAGVTLVCCLMGIFFAWWSKLSGTVPSYVAILAVLLALAQIFLLVRARLLWRNLEDATDQWTESTFGVTTAAVLCNIVLGMLLLGACVGESRGCLAWLAVLGLLASVIETIAALPSARPSRYQAPRSGWSPWATATVCVIVAFLLGGLLLPTLGRARMGSDARRLMMDTRPATPPPPGVSKAESKRGEWIPTERHVREKTWVPSDDSPSPPPAAYDTESLAPTPASPPRLRWDFPETLVFAPEIVTDNDGRAALDVPLADSLTTWQLQADAIAGAGGAAWTTCLLPVTQPFSVDLTLPTDVTAGDVLHVPAVVSNHTGEPRDVELTLALDGAIPTDGLARRVRLGAKAVAATEFVLRFEKPGQARFQLTARAGQESDAVERLLTVRPDAQPVSFSAAGLIQGDGTLDIRVPDDALPGTIRALATFHRTPLTQFIEGLEAMLHEPYGCFEQTSSTSYPNIMVLRYLRAHNLAKPEIERRAQDFIARGYQRLLGFEVGGQSGSFSLYGQAPASAWLTAYGLMQFNDLAEVYPVDPALLARVREWLKLQVRGDGSFVLDGRHAHEPGAAGRGNIAATAYVVWALGSEAPQASLNYLRGNLAAIQSDGYLCALAANALLPLDRATATQLASRLRALAQISEQGGRKTAFLPATNTLAWGYGDVANVEATALGATALLGTFQDAELAQALLAGLQSRAHGGSWGTTHATVLALKALAGAAGAQGGEAVRVVAELDGSVLRPLELPAEETATPAALPLKLTPGTHRLRLQVHGAPVAVRVSGEAWAPWGAGGRAGAAPLQVQISYDAASVRRGQSVLGTLSLTATRAAEVPMVEWGLPAGFAADGADLDALKAKGAITRWERSGRTLRLYLPDLAAAQKVTLPVRFCATAKGELRAPAGRAYEYYRRGEAVALAPARFTVE